MIGRDEGASPSDPVDAELEGRGRAPMLVVETQSTLRDAE